MGGAGGSGQGSGATYGGGGGRGGGGPSAGPGRRGRTAEAPRLRRAGLRWAPSWSAPRARPPRRASPCIIDDSRRARPRRARPRPPVLPSTTPPIPARPSARAPRPPARPLPRAPAAPAPARSPACPSVPRPPTLPGAPDRPTARPPALSLPARRPASPRSGLDARGSPAGRGRRARAPASVPGPASATPPPAPASTPEKVLALRPWSMTSLPLSSSSSSLLGTLGHRAAAAEVSDGSTRSWVQPRVATRQMAARVATGACSERQRRCSPAA